MLVSSACTNKESFFPPLPSDVFPRQERIAISVPQEKVVIKNDDQIGKFGQIVRTASVGTGQSSSNFRENLQIVQTNGHILDSSVKQILVTLSPSISASRKTRRESLQPDIFSKTRHHRKMISCLQILQATHDQLIRENVVNVDPVEDSPVVLGTKSSPNKDYTVTITMGTLH